MVAAGYTRDWDNSIFLIIKAGAIINAVDDNGYTALTYAVNNNELAHIKTLIKAGATVDQTAINIAKKHRHEFKDHPHWGPVTKTILSIVTAAFEDGSLMAAAQHTVKSSNVPEERRASRTSL